MIPAMRIAAYLFYAIAIVVAGVGVYSVAVARTDFGVPAVWIVALFAGGTLLAGLVGYGLHSMAKEREDE